MCYIKFLTLKPCWLLISSSGFGKKCKWSKMSFYYTSIGYSNSTTQIIRFQWIDINEARRISIKIWSHLFADEIYINPHWFPDKIDKNTAWQIFIEFVFRSSNDVIRNDTVFWICSSTPLKFVWIFNKIAKILHQKTFLLENES